MTHRSITRGVAVTALALFFTLLGVLAPASAQGTATIQLNAWLCPEGYDQHADCETLGGVTAQVEAGGVAIGEFTSAADAPATIDVPVGSPVTITVTGGGPEGATLEAAELSFTAVDGPNPVTLVFTQLAAVQPVDSDGDGLSDAEEDELGTDPANVDTDADGVQDGGEVNAGTDPLAPDTDGDGFTDRDELDLGSDPLDPASFPQGTEPNAFHIQAFNCPAGHEGKATMDLCTEPAAGVEFTVYIPGSEFGVTAETDAEGVVTFGDLGSGTYVLRENLDDLGFDITRYTAMCVGNNAPGVPEARQVSYTDLGGGEVEFQLTQGEVITCGWYNLPAADETPAPPKTPATKAPVTKLPATGTGGVTTEPSSSGAPFLIAALVLTALALGVEARRRTAR